MSSWRFIDLQQASGCKEMEEEEVGGADKKQRGQSENGPGLGRLKYMKEQYKIHLVHPWGTLCETKGRRWRSGRGESSRAGQQGRGVGVGGMGE